MEIVSVDPVIDQTNDEDGQGNSYDIDIALPDPDPLELSASTVSSTIRPIMLLLMKNIRILSLNLPLMLLPLRKMLS